MQSSIKVGSVVLSTAGHDSGDYFVVIEVENDEYVKICDGRLRTLEKPKRKKIKHLKNTFLTLDKIAEKLLANEIIHNKNIQTALKEIVPKE
ncbi:MAG: KOW domain-containing RNA-binding protein [Clostridia bacterium]|nr:KOW domain-containing RNA-binding protein [Clostridia bacterium]